MYDPPQNLTEYNTAHNRRISMLGITDGDAATSGVSAAKAKSRNPNKRKRHVTFNEEEIIINPEDVDPSVGRFRNLVQTTVVIPTKRPRFDATPTTAAMPNPYALHTEFARPAPVAGATGHTSSLASAYLPHHLYEDLPPSSADSDHHHHHHAAGGRALTTSGPGSSDLNAKFGIMLPNPAPEVMPLSSGGEGDGNVSSTSTSANAADEHRSDESADSTTHLDGKADGLRNECSSKQSDTKCIRLQTPSTTTTRTSRARRSTPRRRGPAANRCSARFKQHACCNYVHHTYIHLYRAFENITTVFEFKIHTRNNNTYIYKVPFNTFTSKSVQTVSLAVSATEIAAGVFGGSTTPNISASTARLFTLPIALRGSAVTHRNSTGT